MKLFLILLSAFSGAFLLINIIFLQKFRDKGNNEKLSLRGKMMFVGLYLLYIIPLLYLIEKE